MALHASEVQCGGIETRSAARPHVNVNAIAQLLGMVGSGQKKPCET